MSFDTRPALDAKSLTVAEKLGIILGSPILLPNSLPHLVFHKFLPTILCVTSVWLASPSSASCDDYDFKTDIFPVLKSRCVRCHGPKKQSGRVRLDNLSTDLLKNARAAETWHDVLNVVNLGEMPPEDEPQLSTTERTKLVGWLTHEIDRVVKAKKSTGGQVVIRRLNRVEYQNTMRHLIGLDIDYVKNLPPDSLSEDGFKNSGSALTMSGLQLEYYLASARDALSRAIVTMPKPEVFKHTETKSVKDKINRNWSNRLGRTGVFAARVLKFPTEGEFLIRIKAHAELPKPSDAPNSPPVPFPRMQVVLGFRADTQTPSKIVGTVDVANEETETFEFRGRIEEFPIQSRTQSKYPGQLIWVTNAYTDGKPAPKAQRKNKKRVVPEDPTFPKVIIESVEFKAPIFQSWPPKHHTDLLAAKPTDATKLDEFVREQLHRFMSRAFRRPVTDEEVTQYADFFKLVRPRVDSFEAAIRETFAVVLISPEFLYLVEPSSKKRALTQHELASRLSYLLWSTMPDQELRSLADQGQLNDSNVLDKQVERLLKDERSWAFVTQFTDQWLDLGGIDRVAVNPNFYPNFKNSLKPDLRLETQHFFNELLRKNLSALHLIQSDFTMLNQPLAKHYGIDGPRGSRFQRVSLDKAKGRTGGLLTQASILLANSTGEDSHPIKRGVWLRDRLLNDPPAPPPPNVPDLDKNQDLTKLPLRDQLIQHRENAACANCHKDIDPWGLAMEDFDGIGLKRQRVTRRSSKNKKATFPVDARVDLPDGRAIDGLEELKSYLMTYKKAEFAQAVSAKMLTYALGRSLEFTDDPTVKNLADEFAKNDYKLGTLIKQIVRTDAFQTK